MATKQKMISDKDYKKARFSGLNRLVYSEKQLVVSEPAHTGAIKCLASESFKEGSEFKKLGASSRFLKSNQPNVRNGLDYNLISDMEPEVHQISVAEFHGNGLPSRVFDEDAMIENW